MQSFACWPVVASLLISAASTLAAQSAANNPPQSGYTLQAHAREVITDVTVTDRKGNPIHGLNASAFHIFDNGKPQHLASFQEHTGTEPVSFAPERAGNVYSNDILVHPPRAWNVILIDTSSLGFADQAYMNLQLQQFIKQLPPDEPFAVLARRGHLAMYANFTADHQRLLDAVHAVIPQFQRSMDGYALSNNVVDDLCGFLQQFPGRKNVFWFQGAGGLILPPDPTQFVGYQEMSGMYDQLESARIALYPVDVRGLQAPTDPSITSDPSMFEHMGMEDEAESTGGHAVINRNNIADEVKHIADNDASFYTLTYSPQEIKLDNRWHKVKVHIDGGDYQISYRHGYFDDGSNLAKPEGPARKRLLQDGSAVTEVHLAPIPLQVRVKPLEEVADFSHYAVIQSNTSVPKKGERSYDLHYSVPVDAFPQQVAGGENQISLGVGVFAFDRHGRSISRFANKVTVSVSQDRIDAAGPGAQIGFHQQINLPDGEDFLYVAVWNTDTGRAGMIQIPLAVEKPPKH